MWMTETNLNANAYSGPPSDEPIQQNNYLTPTLKMYKDAPQTYPFDHVFVYELLNQPYLGNSESRFGLNYVDCGRWVTNETTTYCAEWKLPTQKVNRFGGWRLDCQKPAYYSLKNL